MNTILKQNNFSIWCDFVERDFLTHNLPKLLKNKQINGMTSNPSIFQNSFTNSPAYQKDIKNLQGKNKKDIYETLAKADIKQAATSLLPLYEQGEDGFISIEVDPSLCHDTQGTIAEGKRLHEEIAMPNVMIKIPATDAGFEAMKVLCEEGINVNATLVFSPTQAQNCIKAFKNSKVKCVISVFVSRFDRKINDTLEKNNLEINKFGIINASYIYHLIEQSNNKNIRTLFASTSIKTPGYLKDFYITELLYKNSINTAPIETFETFYKNNKYEIKTPLKSSLYKEYINQLSLVGIDSNIIYVTLMDEGLKSFQKAFKQMLEAL